MARTSDSFHRIKSVRYLLPDRARFSPPNATIVIEMDDSTEEVVLFAENPASLIPALVHPKDQ